MKRKIKIQSISVWSIGIALILTVVFVVVLHNGQSEVKRFEDATDQYIVCENAARQLQGGSDYLTEQVRLYAMTGERNYLDQYFEEADVTKRREQALESLKKYFDKTEAFQSLQQAMEDSKELMSTEYHSLKIVATAMGEKEIPVELEQLDLSEEEMQLSQKEKLEKAQELVCNNEYQNARNNYERSKWLPESVARKDEKPSAESKYDLFGYVFEVGNSNYDTGDSFADNLHDRKKIDCSTACLL